MRERVLELRGYYARVEQRLAEDSQGIANRERKMGANFKKVGELEEWLQVQKHQRENKIKEGSNVFTYKTQVIRKEESERLREENQRLIEEQFLK